MRLPSTIRAVALLEAAKGALVLLAGFGALSLIHYELFQSVNWLSLGALVVNVFIVGLMTNALLRARSVEAVNAV